MHAVHEVDPDHGLPEDPPRYRKLMHAFRHAGWKMPKPWSLAMRPGEERRAFRAMEKSTQYRAFMAAYRDFVVEEVAPLCGDPEGVVFQSPPTIRVAMPSMVGVRAREGTHNCVIIFTMFF